MTSPFMGHAGEAKAVSLAVDHQERAPYQRVHLRETCGQMLRLQGTTEPR